MTFRTSGTFRSPSPQVDNFVDKWSLGRRPPLRVALARLIAQKSGTENIINIKDLQYSVGAGGVTTVRNASIGAAVELSPRASRRFVDG